MSSRPRAPSWQSIFRILALLSHLVSRTIARTKRVVKPKHGPVFKMRCVFPIESRDKCPSSSLQHGEARERNAVAVAHREGPPGHRCHGAARTSPTFATVAIQQSAGAAGAFECAGRAGRLPVLAIPGARQPRGQRCIAATATPPPRGRRQQCRRQPPHPAAAASCRQHCSDSSLLPRRRRGHECHRHVPRVPPPSASPWPLPPPRGAREGLHMCV